MRFEAKQFAQRLIKVAAIHGSPFTVFLYAQELRFANKYFPRFLVVLSGKNNFSHQAVKISESDDLSDH